MRVYCFKGENFHEFHELMAIRENFTLEILIPATKTLLNFKCIAVMRKMSLLKYFKVVKIDSDAVLANSSGPLAQKILPLRIDVINDSVKLVVETIMDKGKTTRGTYEKFSPDEKARVAKRAAEHGALSTVQHFAKIWPDRPLKEGTVQGWKNRYNHKVSIAKTVREGNCCKGVNRSEERPSTFAGYKQVRAYLTELRANGCPVNTAIALPLLMEL